MRGRKVAYGETDPAVSHGKSSFVCHQVSSRQGCLGYQEIGEFHSQQNKQNDRLLGQLYRGGKMLQKSEEFLQVFGNLMQTNHCVFVC